MAHCNINIVKPEDELETPFTNALQLQSDFGNHFGTPFSDKHILPSSINRYSYPYTSSGFIDSTYLPRPHLTQLSTGTNTYSPEMQHNSNSGGRSNSFPPNLMETSTDEATSVPSEWVFVQETYTDPNSPSNPLASSPRGWSPLTPNTPFLSVEPSPTASSYPSPGSQGSPSSGGFLLLSPSPDIRSSSVSTLSPGSQGSSGSGGFLMLPPSPDIHLGRVSTLSETTTGPRTSPVSAHAGMHPDAHAQYYPQYGADTSPHIYNHAQAHQQTYGDWNSLGENMNMQPYSLVPANYVPPSNFLPPTFSPYPTTPSMSPGEQPTYNSLPSDVSVPVFHPAYNADTRSDASVPLLRPAFREGNFRVPLPIEIPSPPILHTTGGEQHPRGRLQSPHNIVTAPHSVYGEQEARSGPPGEDPAFIHSPSYPIPGVVVPQKMYRPHTASDQRRYVEEVRLDPPIHFYSQDPMQKGISLTDALSSRFIRLKGRDDQLFQNRGPSISVRLVWPCYDAWSRQIPTRDFKNPPGPITRCKLAKNVAKTIQRFIEEHKDRTIEPGLDPRWRVGNGSIEIADLVLLSMHHVSMGSWQANVCLNRPLPALY